MGAEREIDQAQAVIATIQDRRLGRFRTRSRRSDDLTAREAQIVGLIAEGATNSAISTRLVLSVRTVERHIENIGRRWRADAVRSATVVPPTATRDKSTRPHG